MAERPRSPLLNARGQVRAAGGLVWRQGEGGAVEVLLVHRPSYDDWSLPKGKVDQGETDEECALREVEEEAGYRCRLGRELPQVSYADRHGRAKAVRYWAMEAEAGPGAPPADPTEVDEVRWMPPTAAVAMLTYGHDRDLMAAFAESPS